MVTALSVWWLSDDETPWVMMVCARGGVCEGGTCGGNVRFWWMLNFSQWHVLDGSCDGIFVVVIMRFFLCVFVWMKGPQTLIMMA